jgi:hypothetical protein
MSNPATSLIGLIATHLREQSSDPSLLARIPRPIIVESSRRPRVDERRDIDVFPDDAIAVSLDHERELRATQPDTSVESKQRFMIVVDERALHPRLARCIDLRLVWVSVRTKLAKNSTSSLTTSEDRERAVVAFASWRVITDDAANTERCFAGVIENDVAALTPFREMLERSCCPFGVSLVDAVLEGEYAGLADIARDGVDRLVDHARRFREIIAAEPPTSSSEASAIVVVVIVLYCTFFSLIGCERARCALALVG